MMQWNMPSFFLEVENCEHHLQMVDFPLLRLMTGATFVFRHMTKHPFRVPWRYCVNFDDDDLYATVYVERMVNELRQNRGCTQPTFCEVLLP